MIDASAFDSRLDQIHQEQSTLKTLVRLIKLDTVKALARSTMIYRNIFSH